MNLDRIKRAIELIANCDEYDRWHYFTEDDKPCCFETLICDDIRHCRWPDDYAAKYEGEAYYSYVDKERDEITELLPCSAIAQDWLDLTTEQYHPFWEQGDPPDDLVLEFGEDAAKIEDIRNLKKLINVP